MVEVEAAASRARPAPMAAKEAAVAARHRQVRREPVVVAEVLEAAMTDALAEVEAVEASLGCRTSPLHVHP